jgi:P27 family predicted phage terminase small subunit
MSRTRIPVAIKKLRGNPGKRAADLTAGVVLPPSLPSAPDHLPEAAKAIFNETAALLFAIGTMTKADAPGLARYAFNSSLVRQAHRDLATEPTFVIAANGAVTSHPSVRLLREFEPLLAKWETEMGMTAAARSKVSVPPPTGPESATMEFLR